MLYAGKGGVGKTSLAAATGVLCAQRGRKTLLMSLDPAHSLSDAFDLDQGLMELHQGQPMEVAEGLFLQELDVYHEIEANWGEFHRYLSGLLQTSGIEDILAEELAVLPGMEEISALLHINRYVRQKEFDVIILDCAPTAESLRFVSLPKTLEWYMAKVFKLERRIMNLVRPVASRMVDVPLPQDAVYESVARLFERLRGADRLLIDPAITSVRLVTNPEKMVLRETQRAYMFFRLHQLAVDAIILNRILPPSPDGNYLAAWRQMQETYTEMAHTFFDPVPILTAPLGLGEVLGMEQLGQLGRQVFGKKDPAGIFYSRQACRFERDKKGSRVIVHLPFAQKGEVELNKVGDELVIKAGNIKKSLILPRAFAAQQPQGAHLEADELIVEFGE